VPLQGLSQQQPMMEFSRAMNI